jgi:hypothetical protein
MEECNPKAIRRRSPSALTCPNTRRWPSWTSEQMPARVGVTKGEMA